MCSYSTEFDLQLSALTVRWNAEHTTLLLCNTTMILPFRDSPISCLLVSADSYQIQHIRLQVGGPFGLATNDSTDFQQLPTP